MQIATLLSALVVAAASALAADATPKLFDLRSSALPGLIWTPLMYANGKPRVHARAR